MVVNLLEGLVGRVVWDTRRGRDSSSCLHVDEQFRTVSYVKCITALKLKLVDFEDGCYDLSELGCPALPCVIGGKVHLARRSQGMRIHRTMLFVDEVLEARSVVVRR